MVFPRTTEWARFLIRSSIIASSVVLCSSKGWSSVGTFLFVGVPHCVVCLWSEGLPLDVTRLRGLTHFLLFPLFASLFQSLCCLLDRALIKAEHGAAIVFHIIDKYRNGRGVTGE